MQLSLVLGRELLLRPPDSGDGLLEEAAQGDAHGIRLLLVGLELGLRQTHARQLLELVKGLAQSQRISQRQRSGTG